MDHLYSRADVTEEIQYQDSCRQRYLPSEWPVPDVCLTVLGILCHAEMRKQAWWAGWIQEAQGAGNVAKMITEIAPLEASINTAKSRVFFVEELLIKAFEAASLQQWLGIRIQTP
jgi:hypothetical protein